MKKGFSSSVDILKAIDLEREELFVLNPDMKEINKRQEENQTKQFKETEKQAERQGEIQAIQASHVKEPTSKPTTKPSSSPKTENRAKIENGLFGMKVDKKEFSDIKENPKEYER